MEINVYQAIVEPSTPGKRFIAFIESGVAREYAFGATADEAYERADDTLTAIAERQRLRLPMKEVDARLELIPILGRLEFALRKLETDPQDVKRIRTDARLMYALNRLETLLGSIST